MQLRVRGGEYPSRNFATTANSAAASLVGAIIPTQDKATVIGGVKVARGQRKGDRYIAAENDSFNSIIRALKMEHRLL